jgi:serine/threonine protein kinase
MSLRASQLALRPALAGCDIVFEGERLRIATHKPIQILGQGANGFVVLCQNELLNRPEALKVWAKLRPDDSRDKFTQGLEEARKAASSPGQFVAQIYAAGVLLDKYFYATMEYVSGPTLGEYLKSDQRDHGLTLYVAKAYYAALESTGQILHGDPHRKNVIVQEHNYTFRAKLLDFGTSHFTAPENFAKRHWRVVDETFKRIFSNSQVYKAAKEATEKEIPYKENTDNRLFYYHRLLGKIKETDRHTVSP